MSTTATGNTQHATLEYVRQRREALVACRSACLTEGSKQIQYYLFLFSAVRLFGRIRRVSLITNSVHVHTYTYPYLLIFIPKCLTVKKKNERTKKQNVCVFTRKSGSNSTPGYKQIMIMCINHSVFCARGFFRFPMVD